MDKLDSFGFAKFSESLLKHCFGQYQSEREREREMIVFGHMAMWLKKDEQKKKTEMIVFGHMATVAEER